MLGNLHCEPFSAATVATQQKRSPPSDAGSVSDTDMALACADSTTFDNVCLGCSSYDVGKPCVTGDACETGEDGGVKDDTCESGEGGSTTS
jgi:hypothetical protein